MKQKHFIDSHKGVTFVAFLVMMAWFSQWQNPTAWVYLALHGTYGILWMLKSRIFPDAQWEQKTPLWYGLVIWGALTLYWIPPFLLNWRGVQAPAWVLGLAVSLNTLGVFLHFATDMQKYVQLKLQPGQLISDGMMARVRNGNYFGELLIYSAFALLAMDWLAFVPLALFIVFFWAPNMARKEKMLAQLPGFEAYQRRSKLFIPFIF
jgi:protein-S-isoprenylcysteine O-methyltransferase Ste14